jgi:hypothetical protein
MYVCERERERETSRCSVVIIATGHGLNDRGLCSRPCRVKNFHFSITSGSVLGPIQRPISLLLEAFSKGVKPQKRKADHSSATSVEAKATWKIYINSPIRLLGIVLS